MSGESVAEDEVADVWMVADYGVLYRYAYIHMDAIDARVASELT